MWTCVVGTTIVAGRAGADGAAVACDDLVGELEFRLTVTGFATGRRWWICRWAAGAVPVIAGTGVTILCSGAIRTIPPTAPAAHTEAAQAADAWVSPAPTSTPLLAARPPPSMPPPVMPPSSGRIARRARASSRSAAR